MLRWKLMGGLVPSAAAVVLGSGSLAAGSVIYVDAAAPNGGNGSEWAEAFNDLHDALDDAHSGDQIWVVAGTYTPAPPNGNRAISFELVGGVVLYGGFAGWENDLDQRDWIANETILSGDLNGDDDPGFENMDENSFHVLTAVEQDGTVTLDGFVVTGGNANSELWEDSYGGGMSASDTDVAVLNCTIVANRALNDDGSGKGGGIHVLWGDVTLDSTVFRLNHSTMGGGIRIRVAGNKNVSVTDCGFHNNTGSVGAGMIVGNANMITVTDCSFVSNIASSGSAGAAFGEVGDLEMSGCEFIANKAGILNGGCTVFVDTAIITDCRFVANTASVFGGGLGIGTGAAPSIIINSVFSNNSAGLGGGVYCGNELQMINCSFSNNDGHGIVVPNPDEEDFHFIANSVFWGNTPEQVVFDPDVPNPWTLPTICYSDIQGGWDGPGWNNIDVDPLFVQPGADNLRLSYGSPCLDAGDNGEVPPWVETDLDGNPRIVNGIVDMGAYEGSYEALPPADVDYDIDQGDFSLLIPDAEEFNPEEAAAVVLVNTTGPDGATAIVVEHDDDLHPDAAGFSELSSILAEETSLQAGEFKATMYVPFESSDLGGVDPLTLDMTCFDEATGNWALAVSANTQNSPDYDLPIGDRHVEVAPDGWGINNDMGDYGVFWDPAEDSGFVWANVDFAGDFAVGTALCRPDCSQPPDSLVAIEDILFVLADWDRTDGPFDVNADGMVDIDDVFAILAAWGACP